MMKKKPPLSPHLQIYKPQMTSMLSILHRFTGGILSVAVFSFVLFIYGVVTHDGLYNFFIIESKSGFGKFVLTGVIFSFWYHFSNGIRHLVWDAGYDLDLKNIYTSGYFVITLSMLLTGTTALLFWGELV